MEDIDKEISEMKISLNARARIVAEGFLKNVSRGVVLEGVAFCTLLQGRYNFSYIPGTVVWPLSLASYESGFRCRASDFPFSPEN